MTDYSLSEKAVTDLSKLYEYGVNHYGLSAADAYYDSLIERLESIAKSPYLYRVAKDRKGYRMSVCGKHSIYYKIFNDKVLIVRILQRQNFS